MNKPTRFYSNNQEKGVAKKLGGKVQSNSGATPFYKGDVDTRAFLIECKTATTKKQSMSIKKEWLDKLKEETFAMNRNNYALCFNFGGLDNKENFYIINERTFMLLNKLIEEENKDE